MGRLAPWRHDVFLSATVTGTFGDIHLVTQRVPDITCGYAVTERLIRGTRIETVKGQFPRKGVGVSLPEHCVSQ